MMALATRTYVAEIAIPLLGDSSPAQRPLRRGRDFTCPVLVAVSIALVSVAIFGSSTSTAAVADTKGQGMKIVARQVATSLNLAEESQPKDTPLIWRQVLVWAIRFAGIGQLALCVASAAIPYLLDWEKEFAGVQDLLKKMFLVYAAYILCINFSFGLLSSIAPDSLVAHGFMPVVVSAFIFVYWGARVLVELFVFDLSHLNRSHEICGRRGIELLFTYLTLVYGLALLHNLDMMDLDVAVPDIGPFGRMLVIIIVLFSVMKLLVISMPESNGPKLSCFGTLVFFCVWPGMQPATLLERKPGLQWWKDLVWGLLFSILGLFWSIGTKICHQAGLSDDAAGLVALPGISMMFHVGGLRLLRGFLRLVGYDVEQLFVDPLLAKSVSEFWGKRWNIAFSDMNRFVFVAAVRTALEEDLSVSKAKSKQAGIFAAFVASAILHECAITLPVLAGYGGPSLYFLLQGFYVVLEKQPSMVARLERHPLLGRCITLAVIALPVPVCFVAQFRTQIALPLVLFVADAPQHLSGFLSINATVST